MNYCPACAKLLQSSLTSCHCGWSILNSSSDRFDTAMTRWKLTPKIAEQMSKPHPALEPKIPNGASMNRIDRQAFEDARAQAGEQAYEIYDFGDIDMEDISRRGFGHTSGENTYVCEVYFPDIEDPDASITGYFTVVFQENSAEIINCYASINGNDIGFYPPLRA
jgi:hypothetical protein